MERVARLIEIECWEGQQIETRLDQLRVTDDDFNACLKLLLIPKL
jgi:hypothetical protein